MDERYTRYFELANPGPEHYLPHLPPKKRLNPRWRRRTPTRLLFILVILLLLGVFIANTHITAKVSAQIDELPPCYNDPDTPVCETIYDWDMERIKARIDSGDPLAWRDKNALVFVYHAPGAEAVYLFGGIQAAMHPLGGNIWGIAVEIDNLSEIVLTYDYVAIVNGAPQFTGIPSWVWRGTQAPPDPVRADPLAGTVESHSLTIEGLDEEREVFVYAPPDHDSSEPLPVIYMADGQVVEDYAPGIETLIVEGALPPLLLVGVRAAPVPLTGGPEADLRAQEYLPDINPSRYAAHEAFFMGDVAAWAEAEYGASPAREDRFLFGFSNGARFALDMGLKYSDSVGGVIAFSVAWGEPQTPLPAHEPLRVYLEGGTLEPGFLRNSIAWTGALVAAGDIAIFTERNGGHDRAVWISQFPLALDWILEQ